MKEFKFFILNYKYENMKIQRCLSKHINIRFLHNNFKLINIIKKDFKPLRESYTNLPKLVKSF